MRKGFERIEHAISHLKAGCMIILTDDENRENEGDLVMSASHVTAEAINFMTRYGRGLVCLPMAGELIDRLALPLMTSNNRSPYGTAFTVSIEAAHGVSTGISAHDRAHTILTAINPAVTPDDMITPGHIFPLRAREGGVLVRGGQTEGSVDLMKLADLPPAAVICEIMNDDGTMSRQDDLRRFSEQHQIPLVSIRELIDYRIAHECLIEEAASSSIPVAQTGEFDMRVFYNALDSAEHFALIKPPVNAHQVPLVRIHSECITGDLLGSMKCDCGEQLHQSLQLIGKEGGALIYLRQEGRGIGLANKLKAYVLQEQGMDTVEANLHLGLPADARDYACAYQILKFLGFEAIRLLTNNPAKVACLEKYGLIVSERVPLMVRPTDVNRRYLETKQSKLGHMLDLESLS